MLGVCPEGLMRGADGKEDVFGRCGVDTRDDKSSCLRAAPTAPKIRSGPSIFTFISTAHLMFFLTLDAANRRQIREPGVTRAASVSVPEPTTLPLFALGVGMTLLARRRRHALGF